MLNTVLWSRQVIRAFAAAIRVNTQTVEEPIIAIVAPLLPDPV